MDDYILIANPISGKGKARTVAERTQNLLMDSGRKGQLKFTTGSRDAKDFAEVAASDGIKWVIVCGGDGTLHEVVNGIATVSDVTLSIIPCGRGNDLASAIGVPRKIEKAVDTLFDGTEKCIDLGYVRSDKGSEHYFTTIATCGYDTEVSRRGAARDTLLGIKISGTASYLYAAVVTLFHYKSPFVQIEGDFGKYEGEILLAATGNTNSYGGGFKIVPNAVHDDGLFDVCIIRPLPSFTILRLMVTLFWGGHVNHPAVEISQTRSVKINSDPPVMLFADGEPMCETPATIEIIKQGLKIKGPS
ncbi:diacylglycerol kinase family lipid kinase [Candidatus Poribacteria bacterium]|nr:diacylglycerol kinase family lipid kinase [Candidatus Poribacteria bacterium]MYB64623.1 diacylglycerol kinase family lipid kinase [Candidatus Poribacteria bacterium]